MSASSSNSWFHSVYIIDANSGLTILSKDYSNDSFNEDMISGMFKALESFMNHLSYSHQTELVQDINFEGLRIIYEREGQLRPVLGVAIMNKRCPLNNAHKILKAIVEEFHETYANHLVYFRGNISPFIPFMHKLEHLDDYYIRPKRDLIISDNLSPKFPVFHGFQKID